MDDRRAKNDRQTETHAIMIWAWLKHAFAIPTEGPFEPTEDQRVVVDRFCRLVVERGLATPAMVFLESVQPLNYVSAQTLHFFGPILSAVADPQICQSIAEFLENRGSVDYLCRQIDALSKAKKRERGA